MSWNQVAISTRDGTLLSILATKVKALTIGQIHRTWWPACASDHSSRRRLRQLENAGFLQLHQTFAFSEIELHESLAEWRPGEADPDLRNLLKETRTRWSRSIETVTVVSITPATATLYGGNARRVRPSEVTHDIHVAQVFLKKLSHEPLSAEAWINESCLSRQSCELRAVVPDALIRMATDTVAVEVVGESYTLAKLERFCAYCRGHGWSYELW